MSRSVEIRTLTTPQELFASAAEETVRIAKESVTESGRFTLALSGGSTPKSLYNLLATNAKAEMPWDQTYFFWGDERHVPPEDAESNYRMVNEAMLSKVSVPTANVFRIGAENPDASAAALEYEKALQKFFQLDAGQFPKFDLILLGIGPDGHTASLFPGTTALQEKSRLVVSNWVAKFNTDRLTFTLPVLNAAHNVMFLVSGTDKAPALQAILEGDAPGEQYPAKLVKPVDGKLIWMVDRAAASGLKLAP